VVTVSPSVRLGLQSLCEAFGPTVQSMTQADEDEDLVEKLLGVMGVNSISAEMMLGTYFDASVLAQYATSLGKSPKGSVPVLAERIAREWAKPSFTPPSASAGPAKPSAKRAAAAPPSARPPKRACKAAPPLDEESVSATPELVRRQAQLAKAEAAALVLVADANAEPPPRLAREPPKSPSTLSEGQRAALAAALLGKKGMGVSLAAITNLSLQRDGCFSRENCRGASLLLAELLCGATELASLDCHGDYATTAAEACEVLEPILESAPTSLQLLCLPPCVECDQGRVVASVTSQRLASSLRCLANLKKVELEPHWPEPARRWVEGLVPPGCAVV